MQNSKKFLIFLSLASVFLVSATRVKQTWKKSEWMADAFQTLKSGKYPNIKAISYWHEKWKNNNGQDSNLWIDSSNDSLKVYQTQIASPLFVSVLDFNFSLLQSKVIAPESGRSQGWVGERHL
jgi:hypothetical protein